MGIDKNKDYTAIKWFIIAIIILIISFGICYCVGMIDQKISVIPIFLSIKSILFVATLILTIVVFLILCIWLKKSRCEKGLRIGKLDIETKNLESYFGEKSYIRMRYKEYFKNKKEEKNNIHLINGLLKMRRKFFRAWFWVFCLGILMYFLLCMKEYNKHENNVIGIEVTENIYQAENDTTIKKGDKIFFKDSIIISLETRIKYEENCLWWNDSITKILKHNITIKDIKNCFPDTNKVKIKMPVFSFNKETLYIVLGIDEENTLTPYYIMRKNPIFIKNKIFTSYYDIDKNLLEHSKQHKHYDNKPFKRTISFISAQDTEKMNIAYCNKDSSHIFYEIYSDSIIPMYKYEYTLAKQANISEKTDILKIKIRTVDFNFRYEKAGTNEKPEFDNGNTARSKYPPLFNILSMLINVLLLSLFAFFNTKIDVFGQETDEEDYRWVRWFSYLMFGLVCLVDSIITFMPFSCSDTTYSTVHFIVECTVAIFSVIAIFGVWGSMANQYTAFKRGFKLIVFVYSVTQIFAVFLGEENQIALCISIFLLLVAFIAKILIIIEIWNLFDSKRLSWYFLNEANETRSESHKAFRKIFEDWEYEEETRKKAKRKEDIKKKRKIN